MTDVETLLRSYVERFQAGGPVDPSDLLSQVEGRDRERLSALIDGYLEHAAPPQRWDADAFEGSVAQHATDLVRERWEGEAQALPRVLVERRKALKLHRSKLVASLAERLGFPAQEEKVAHYYNALEHGWLEPGGVSGRVWDGLANVLETSADVLRKAGESVAPSAGGESAEVYARMSRPAPAIAESLADSDDATPDQTGDWDELDRLFRAG